MSDDERRDRGTGDDTPPDAARGSARGSGRGSERHSERDAGRAPDDGAGATAGDPAYDRLVAADPAADVEPRAGVLRAKVGDLLGGDGPGRGGTAANTGAAGAAAGAVASRRAPGTTDEDAAAPELSDELAARRDRRRTPWLVAAAVAGVLAVGGGGYAVGLRDSAGDEFAAAGQAEPAVALEGGGAGGGAGAADGGAPALPQGDGSAGGVAPEAGSAAADSARSATLAWTFGRAVFHAQGLDGAAGEASAYGFDARATGTAETARRVADALGVAGDVRDDGGSWWVGPQDGSAPSVWVSADGRTSFGYSDPAADPWRCVPTSDGSCPTPPATSVTDEAAVDALRDVMVRLGVDPSGYEVEVQERSDGDPQVWVTAWQVVDGRRTGDMWGASVGDGGVAWLDGALAPVVPLGTYPVVSPREAVERLGDPRFQASYPVRVAEDVAQPRTLAGPEAPGGVPAPPQPGAAIAWPVADVTITGARLALTGLSQPDGAMTFVPAYELSDATGNTWSVVAVADEALDFAVR